MKRVKALRSSGASTSAERGSSSIGHRVVAATLGAAYALAGRADEALPLVAAAVEEFRRRQTYNWPAFILLSASMTCLSAGRIDEAASHAREALALARRLGARGSEAHALCLAGEVASLGGAADAEGSYRQALALADVARALPTFRQNLWQRSGRSPSYALPSTR